MLIAFLIWGAMTTIVVVIVGSLAVIGFVVEAPKEFPEQFDREATPPPTHPIVTELCRHEIPGVNGKEGRLLMVEFPPGVHSDPHRHPGALFAHVLQGTVLAKSADAPPRQHGPGDTWYEPPVQPVVRDSNEGSETAKLLIFDLTEPGQPLQFFEPDEESSSVPQAKTRTQAESSLTPAAQDTAGSR